MVLGPALSPSFPSILSPEALQFLGRLHRQFDRQSVLSSSNTPLSLPSPSPSSSLTSLLPRPPLCWDVGV